MFGRRWRTRAELKYLAKYQIRNLWPSVVIGIWSGIFLIAVLILKTSWENDLPNWFAALIGMYFGVIVAIIGYSRAKKTQDVIEAKVNKIEGFLNSQFTYKDVISNSKFYLSYALNGIIETYAILEKDAKKWKRIKDQTRKKFFKEKILYIWEKSIFEYAKILDNTDIVSEKLFESEDISELKTIADACKIKPTFDEKSNKINDNKFHRKVISCIVLLDKLKIDSKFREVLLKY